MISITVEQDHGRTVRIISEGHALYDESGSDIICAAVSALMITTANALDQFTDAPLVIDEGEGDGYLSISVPDQDHDADLLMKSLYLGLESIRENYGDSYLRISVRSH